MSRVARLLRRVRAFLGKRALDADLDAELAAHLEMAIEDNLARGLSPGEARRVALISIGGIQQAREKHRETRGIMTLDILGQDIRYTLRTLGRDRGFTAVAVLILALAIGANIAVFSVVNTILLRPLPFPNAQQLVWIAPPPTKCGLSCATYSTDAYDEFRVNTRSFQDVTGYFAFSSPDNLKLVRNGGAPIPATGIDVIQNFFQVLGVQPAMGRAFTAEDGRHGAAPVVLLSDAWWRRQFNADPNIVGKAIDLNGKQTTVIGVLPRSFDFGAVFLPGAKVDAITPLDLYGPPRDWGNIITMIGRMKPGVTLGQAQGDAKAAERYMCWNNRSPNGCGKDYKDAVVPVPLKDYISGKLRRSLVVLWSAVGAILLIACVNLSNLLLARASARSKEFAMRGALGATPRTHRAAVAYRKPDPVGSGRGAGTGAGLRAGEMAGAPGVDRAAASGAFAHRRRGAGMDGAGGGIGGGAVRPRAGAAHCGRQPAGGAEGIGPGHGPQPPPRAGARGAGGDGSGAGMHAAGGRGPVAAQLPEGSGRGPGIPAGAGGGGDGGLRGQSRGWERQGRGVRRRRSWRGGQRIFSR